ncbi:DUF4365 domain-containing protein [Solirubrobacter soli]|uniref:DUF4365 domain-containing protein n=1 Tax=Solirubrobacter soli TaxID=363832 RepID=UPI0012F8B019|nr:DUF4365 domain-containing protein [Solirubrobacter soli]
MTGEGWQWSTLSRGEVRDRAREVVAGALERSGYSTTREGSIITAQGRGRAIEVHVRSLRKVTYQFWEKRRFDLAEGRYGALVLLFDGQPPASYLIPSLAWTSPTALLVDRNYEGLASEPEWGLNLSGRTLPTLDAYRLSVVLRTLDEL